MDGGIAAKWERIASANEAELAKHPNDPCLRLNARSARRMADKLAREAHRDIESARD